MQVLIVESNPELGELWKSHLVKQGLFVDVANDQSDAIELLTDFAPDIIILNLVLNNGSALAVADFASYRCPKARVIFVTNTTFFSDGSIFAHVQNACAFVQTETPPDDLVAMVEHYGSTHSGAA